MNTFGVKLDLGRADVPHLVDDFGVALPDLRRNKLISKQKGRPVGKRTMAFAVVVSARPVSQWPTLISSEMYSRASKRTNLTSLGRIRDAIFADLSQ